MRTSAPRRPLATTPSAGPSPWRPVSVGRAHERRSEGIEMVFRRRHEEQAGQRFQMQERMISIGDDYWIVDDRGERVFKVDGKAARLRDTWVLEDFRGEEVAKIKERKNTIRDTIKIELAGREETV